MVRKLYVQTPDGQVFTHATDNDYQYASCGAQRDDAGAEHWYVNSWHRRIDLALKAVSDQAANNPTRLHRAIQVSQEPLHGTCGRCDGTGKHRCGKCYGRHSGDSTLTSYPEIDGKIQSVETVTGHWTCTCPADGLVKCNVCKGKGQL